MAGEKEKVPNSARIQELWTAIRTLLEGKVDADELQEYATIEGVATAISTALMDYAKTSTVDNKISDALTDYITEAEVNSKIVEAVKNITTFRKEVVSELPPTGEDNVIYLIPNPKSSDGNSKLEYLWIDGAYELIGSTDVDLSNYWSKDDMEIMTKEDLSKILEGAVVMRIMKG